MMGKRWIIGVLTWTLISSLAAEVPAVLKQYFKEGAVVEGHVVRVETPDELKAYVKKVENAAKKNMKWFREYSAKAEPGVPLPYHEKLGLTRKEYDEYLAIWAKRKLVPVQDGAVTLRLEEAEKGTWMIRVGGPAYQITNLRFDTASGNFKSPKGTLEQIEDVQSDARSLLGKWSGQEWKYSEQGDYVSVKENLALGKLAKENNGLLVYRLQEISSGGNLLANDTLVIRFPLPSK